MDNLVNNPPIEERHIDETNQVTRSQETLNILQPLLGLLTEFLAKADVELSSHHSPAVQGPEVTSLLSQGSPTPDLLSQKLGATLKLPDGGNGQHGLLETAQNILRYSVNTSAPGFLDKLYSSPLPPGIAADLVLAVLNTNVHVYQVSPVLTLIEKKVTKALANMFGLVQPRAGGISVQGGSASNLTSIVLARNTLFPHTKVGGNRAENDGRLILFTSSHGHYSIEKAAQALGLGSQSVVQVPVNDAGQMLPTELDKLIAKSRLEGNTPFYINATAGSTVLGSFDPFEEIANVAKKHQCWFHIDGAWGGSFVFARRGDMRSRLQGAELADSIAINPHKMLGVPLTCSFLLTRDLRLLEAAMTLRAGYLFHDVEDNDEAGTMPAADDGMRDNVDSDQTLSNITSSCREMGDGEDDEAWHEPDDLADLTLQCGRRGDSLKLFLSWRYYGTNGYQNMVENAYQTALEFSDLIDHSDDFTLVLGPGSRPQCLQVCFHYTPGGKSVFSSLEQGGILVTNHIKDGQNESDDLKHALRSKKIGKLNTIVTSRITKALIPRGFMIDFAPALDGQEETGSFFRVVVNISTRRETIQKLVREMSEVGAEVVDKLRPQYPH